MGPATPKIDKMLAANLAKAKMAQAAKPYFFALVLKGGGTSGKLLVDRLKIKEKAIGDAKKATGGSAVVIGVCYWDKQLSKLIFETNKPALPTWAQLVKLLAKKEAGLSIEPKFVLAQRKVEEIKEPEDEEEDEKVAPKDASPEKKQGLEKWNERFDALKTKLVEAGKAGKPWAKGLWLKLSEAGTIYRQGKEDQAKAMFKEVVEAYQKFTAAPAGTSGQQAAAATAKTSLTSTQAASSSKPTAEEEWKKARAQIEPAYLQGVRSRPDDASKLRAVMGFAQGKAEKGDFPGALAAMKALKDVLAKAPTGTTGGKVPEGVTTGKVSAAVLGAEVQQLRLQAAKGLDEVLAKIRGERDPRAAQVAEVVGQLAKDMPGELEKVLRQLEAAVKSGEAQAVKKQKAAVQQSAKEWMTFLQTRAALIRRCEANPWGIAVAIEKPLRASLTAILNVAR